MTRARSLETGDGTAGARIEYVRNRRMFRLGGWHAGGRTIDPLEVPMATFLRQLGVGGPDTGVPPVYLLLAGLQDRPSCALRHVATAFATELEARQAFRRLHAGHRLPDEWAQVVALDSSYRLLPICWFGAPGRLGDEPAEEQEEDVAPRPRRWGPRRVRGSVGRAE